MIAVAVSGMLVCWARHQFRGKTRWWIPLALIPLAVLFLQFPISGPVWNLLPKLRFLQFPWRWLVVLEAPMGIFFASAVWLSRRGWRIAVLACLRLVFLAATGVRPGSAFFRLATRKMLSRHVSVYRAGTGFEGADEYAPAGRRQFPDRDGAAGRLPEPVGDYAAGASLGGGRTRVDSGSG